MSKRMTRDEIETAYRVASESESRTLRALSDILANKVVATEQSEPDLHGTTYTYRLLRPTAPDGGLLVITFHCPGQTDSVSVHLAEPMLSPAAIGKWGARCWGALERIIVAYHGANDAAYPASRRAS